jgi:hypothetical protein
MSFGELQLTCQGEVSSWHRSGELANIMRSFACLLQELYIATKLIVDPVDQTPFTRFQMQLLTQAHASIADVVCKS